MDPKYHRLLMVHNKEKANKSSSETFDFDTFERQIIGGNKKNIEESNKVVENEKDCRNEKEEKQNRRQKHIKVHEKRKKNPKKSEEKSRKWTDWFQNFLSKKKTEPKNDLSTTEKDLKNLNLNPKPRKKAKKKSETVPIRSKVKSKQRAVFSKTEV
ncbi:hypothetical protein QYM36_000664 [Artemia franciscana]|uniref:Uncharacterized protein n=1 Tax=Artemia franciscana TaxID=6661 RepID=A0AA88IFI6_ARTSF|nr:hypothetical protein QYM36_000664 [Artemia franciscana]